MLEQLKPIFERGYLKVAVSKQIPGFSTVDNQGVNQGFDIDLLRALAAAMLGNKDALQLVEVEPANRIEAVVNKECDLGLFNLSINFTRLNQNPIHSPCISFYDGEAALIRADVNTIKLSDLNSPTIAVQDGTTTPDNLAQYFAEQPFNLKQYSTHISAMDALISNKVDAYVLDSSMLYSSVHAFDLQDQFRVTQDQISFEPLGPVFHQDSTALPFAFFWVFQCLLQAERKGLGFTELFNPVSELKHLHELHVQYQEEIILEQGFFDRIVQSVGNYKEIFNRNLGVESGFNVNRGFNNLVENGGLFAPLSI